MSLSVGFHTLQNVRVCTSLKLILCPIPLRIFLLSLQKSNWIKILASLSSGLSKELHVLLSCGCRDCNLARLPPGSCLHLRNFTCPPCPSIQGASCQNCRHWRQKYGISLFILTPYIQLICFIAYHLLVPKHYSCSSSLSFPFPLLSLHAIPCTPLETAAYFLACYKISSLYKKLLYSCMTLEGTCWPFCHSSLMRLI